MKKILSLVLTLGAAVAVHAQGNFLPGTYFSDDSNSDHIGGTVTDNTLSGPGPGGHALAFGSGYQAQWYIGAANTTDASTLTAVGPQAGFLGSSGSDTAGGAGYFEGNSDNAISTTFGGGATVTLQLRAWKGGAGSTFSGASIAGSSALIQVVLGDPNHNPPIAATQISNLPNFGMIAVGPEPTTIALGLMGAGALFIRRRKV